MNNERYRYLIENVEAELTEEEIKQGWHFCPDWDLMLIHPNMPESDCCSCFKEEKK